MASFRDLLQGFKAPTLSKPFGGTFDVPQAPQTFQQAPKVDVRPSFGTQLRTAGAQAFETATQPITNIASTLQDILARNMARQRSGIGLTKQALGGTPITPFQARQFRSQAFDALKGQVGGTADITKQGLIAGTRAVGATRLPALAAFTALGTGLGFGVNKFRGQTNEQALRGSVLQSVENLPRTAGMVGVNQFTQPLMNKQISGILSKYPALFGQVAARGTSSALNVGEGLLMDVASGFKTTPQSIALDALTGATIFAGGANAPIKQAVSKRVGPAIEALTDITKDQFGGIQISDNLEEMIRLIRTDPNVRLDESTGIIRAPDVEGGLSIIGRIPTNAVRSLQTSNAIASNRDAFNLRGDNPLTSILANQGGFARIKPEPTVKLPEEPTRAQQDFEGGFRKLIGDTQIAGTRATEVSEKYASIPLESSREVIDVMEGVARSTDPKVNKAAEAIRADLDNMFREANSLITNSGLDIKYLDNYFPHFWKESKEATSAAFINARKQFPGAKERTIPTYSEGVSIGLTPKFDHPAQVLQEYSKNLGEFRARMEFFGDLRAKNIIRATPSDGFVPIRAEGFGKSKRVMEDKVIIGDWYAPKELAPELNRVFSPPEPTVLGNILSKSANISGGIQDLALSGGLPGTPVNAFVVAQVQKELLSGRVKSPLKSIVNSMSLPRSQKFFSDNSGQIIKMQERNVPIRSSYDVNNLIDRKIGDRLFGKGLKGVWSQLMNDPTFGRFMPILQIRLFNDIEARALKSGIGEKAAADIASKGVSNFYGLSSTAKEALADKQLKDLGSTLLFAPRYRESMVNFWARTLKAMKNPLSPENITNTKFAVGAILTYITMDQINRAYNGHGMQDNPDWKKDKILIPMDDGFTLGIPYLSSIATVPRGVVRIGREVLKGDVSEASKETFRTFASIGLKPLGEISANQDHFGREIYLEDDTPKEKLVKQVGHIFKSVNHPYVREFIELHTKPDKPLGQRLSMALELPFRFYTTESVQQAYFWDRYNDVRVTADKYKNIKGTPEGEEFLAENEDLINEFNILKGYLSEYFDEVDEGGESDILKNFQASLSGIDPSRIPTEKTFETSADAPQTGFERFGLGAEAVLRDPGGTLQSLARGEPFRKIRGGELVTERRTDISEIDIGKKGTQVDHRIPKWAGGRDTVENYQALTTADHRAKTNFEAGLRAQVERGTMSQEKARKEIEKWHKTNGVKPVSLTRGEVGKIKKVVDTGVVGFSEIDTYTSGAGMKVSERGDWAFEQIKDLKGEELQKALKELWDSKVLTGSSRGVAQYIKDTYGMDVSKDKVSKAKPKKGKVFTIKAPKSSAVKTPTIRIKAPPATPRISTDRITRAGEFKSPGFKKQQKIRLTSRPV